MTVDLAGRLEGEGVAGRIVTPIGDVYRKIRMVEEGDIEEAFGLAHLLPATRGEISRALEQLGVDLSSESGQSARSWVDPQAVVAQSEKAADRLRVACERGEHVLFGTGHPAGPIELYATLAAAMRERGARVLRFAEGEPFQLGWTGGRAEIRYLWDVACLSGGGKLLHTHSARPAEYLLDAGPHPDLVVGDHGFAGAGLARGAAAVALVDTNDAGLILAWARGLPISPIICDDNRPPRSYRALGEFLVDRLR